MHDRAETLISLIESRKKARARPSGHTKDAKAVFAAAVRLVDDYVVRLAALESDVAGVNFNVDGQLGDVEAVAAMERIEAHVNALLARRRKVRGWRVDRRGGEGKDILIAMFDHLLGEVSRWLQSILTALQQPLPESAKASSNGTDNIRSVVLAYFERPPQVSELDAWTSRYGLAGNAARRSM